MVEKNKTQANSQGSKLMINIYGLMAILFVIIPEWMAELGISIDSNYFENELPETKYQIFEDKNPYLKNLNIKELRLIASDINLICYSCDNKRILLKRVERRIKYIEKIKLILKKLKVRNLC